MTAGVTTPPRPPLAIRVGVTGHRLLPTLPAEREPAIAAAVVRALAAVTVGAADGRARHPDAFDPVASASGSAGDAADPAPAEGAIVSSLAEGVDQIVAGVGLDQGSARDAVLPFAPEENARDFPDPDARERLDTLLGRARAHFFLDGQRDADDAADKPLTKRA